MNTEKLLSLQKALHLAEKEYREADGFIDASPLQIILAKEVLKEARFAWNEASSEFVTEYLKEIQNVSTTV